MGKVGRPYSPIPFSFLMKEQFGEHNHTGISYKYHRHDQMHTPSQESLSHYKPIRARFSPASHATVSPPQIPSPSLLLSLTLRI
ncbi:hypothetical protein VNO80_11551 [Phaseolus coccineus]|uniref:Uncharacterized protein n=1 Tax=Phaseolus coccineus TaxID=3886 RepID=A0AAN9RF14_PHACN